MISFENVTFSYGEKDVFDGLNLSLPEGTNVLVGASGSGKTTLLKLIAGLLTPEKGMITGVPLRPAVMFQENRLMPWLTARENVEAALPRERRREAVDWLRFVELEELEGRRPGDMSGGQQRRVALARALAFGGDLLIMDEPLKGLDEALIERLVPNITALGLPIVVTSHSEFETKLWGGKVTVLGSA